MMQSFYLGHQLLGERPAPLVEVVWGVLSRPLSRALLCRHCGEIWARIAVTGSKWAPIVASCAECNPHEATPPGTLCVLGYPELEGDDLPLAVLHHDFECALRAIAPLGP